MEIINRLKELEIVSRQLEPTSEVRNQWNAQVLEYSDDFLNALHESAVFQSEFNKTSTDDLKISEQKHQLNDLLLQLNSVDQAGINPASPRHLGYIPGGGLFPSALGDYLADVTNKYAGIFYASPGAVRIENTLCRWMCDLMGYPETAIGNLTSGGSISNLIAVVAARETHQIKARNIEKTVIYLSEQAHHSVLKAIKIAGLSEAIIRFIPLDDGLRMSANHLEATIKEDVSQGLQPFFINTSFGTTNSGAIDPIEDIARIAKNNHTWLHVDAAYGGFFKLSQSMEHKYQGINEADSITLDPHKTLFLPFGTGTILIKEKKHALNAFHHLADYMQDTVIANEEISPSDISPELTKHYRGLRLWLPLKLFGLTPFKAALEEKLLLAQYAYKQLQNIDGMELGPKPELSVAMFRYLPKNGNANNFNQQLTQAIQEDGRVFLSSTSIAGIFWIRIAVVSFRTHKSEIDLALQIIQEKIHQLTTS